jgi:hypothetical protein
MSGILSGPGGFGEMSMAIMLMSGSLLRPVDVQRNKHGNLGRRLSVMGPKHPVERPCHRGPPNYT